MDIQISEVQNLDELEQLSIRGGDDSTAGAVATAAGVGAAIGGPVGAVCAGAAMFLGLEAWYLL